LAKKGHRPSSIYRGHKADIFEGGHRIPFIVRWPEKIKPNSIAENTICLTDLIATCSDILGIPLQENEGEDSFSLLPIFSGEDAEKYERKATVHHSINGSFAIRKENWKLIFCPDSGGWSDPKPNTEGIDELPEFQLYDLAKDPGERTNLFASHPEKVKVLRALMSSYIKNGRSTEGPSQKNNPETFGTKDWKQISIFK